MEKKKPTPAEAGKETKTLTTYFLVLVKPAENKNKENPLENAKIAVFLAETNDSTKDNSTTTTTTTTRPEEVTLTGTSTAPADEENKLGLEKTDKEESEKSDNQEEVEEEELEDEVTVNADYQKSYFNGGTEEVTNMGTDMVTTNKKKLLENNTDGPEEQEEGQSESNEVLVEEKTEPYSLFGV